MLIFLKYLYTYKNALWALCYNASNMLNKRLKKLLLYAFTLCLQMWLRNSNHANNKKADSLITLYTAHLHAWEHMKV